ncbi:LacI family transcriptional regulator [Rathayibacter sp. PhB151]|nr:LacI family transcriptional regulator [Rathayibacter sp. PhB151]
MNHVRERRSQTEDMTEASRRPSLADVARLAGVAPVTASRVANGQSNVVPTTRAAVLDAMRALGYRPNSAARALKSGSFRTIGVAVFSLDSLGMTRTIDSIARAAAAAGYAITLVPVSAPSQTGLNGAFTRFGELAVDGLIVIVETHLRDTEELTLPEIPRVLVNAAAGARGPVVDADQAGGVRAAVEHLLQLGHRTVHHIAGPRGSYAAERREAAWRETLLAAGAPVPPVRYSNWRSDGGHLQGAALAEDSECTAVLVSSDEAALGVYRAFAEHGLRIPEDVSVVGFNDIPEAQDFSPPLTTIRQDYRAIGERCVARLLEQLAHGVTDEPVVELVPTTLIVRASTAPPAKREADARAR